MEVLPFVDCDRHAGRNFQLAQHDLSLRLQYRVGPCRLTAGVTNALNYNYTQQERNLSEIRSFVFGVSARL